MTKEQEEAIERLKQDVKYSDLADVDDDCTICFIEDVETVLNLIQEQQKENEKKDKIIDEAIGFLATRTWATCPNEDCGANLDCENRCSNDDNIYEECWKMYFENQARM